MSKPTSGFYKVRRPFDAGGVRVAPGEIVDVTGWRNAWQLVDRGYLIAVPEIDKPAPAPAAVKTTTKKTPAKKAAAKKTTTAEA